MSQLIATKNKKVRFVTSFGVNTLKQHGTVVSSLNEHNCGLKSAEVADDIIDLGKFVQKHVMFTQN